MGSEADARATGTTLDIQRGKFQMNLPQSSLAQRARQPWVCPFGNKERFGHSMHLGALQEVLSEERWSLTLLGNHITSKCTHKHRLSQKNKNTQYSLNKHQAFLPLGEGNGTPLQYSCLENPMDGGAW